VLVRGEAAVEQHGGQPVVHLALDRPAQRAGAELGRQAAPGEPFDRPGGEVHRDCLRVQPAARLPQQQAGDPAQLCLVKLTEDDDLVDAVDELRPEGLAQPGEHSVASVLPAV
jgi:hypothetical protein